MSRVKSALRSALPPPVLTRVQAARGGVARVIAATELYKLRQEMDQLRADVAELLARHTQDLVARNDAVLSNYDRRVASVANRVLDLEARVTATARADDGDANRILMAHEKHPS